MADREERARIFAATLRQTTGAISKHADVGKRVVDGLNSTRLHRAPRPLVTPQHGYAPRVEVWSRDVVDATLRAVNDERVAVAGIRVEARAEDEPHRVCVMNLASETSPGGGVERGAQAQEEKLCCCSTLYEALNRARKNYPLQYEDVLYTRDVLFFRRGDYSILDWPETRFADVVSVAALKRPKLIAGALQPEDASWTRDIIRAALRACALNDARILVLGALGCGAYCNPPVDIARAFKSVLSEREFGGRFARVVFAITDAAGTQNLATFTTHLHGIPVGSG